VVLSDADYPYWQADVTLQHPEAELYYKYGIWDPATHTVVQLETGDNRVLPGGSAALGTLRIADDEGFRYAAGPWRGWHCPCLRCAAKRAWAWASSTT
jgi:4-alpha-glucanotransferase